MAFRKCIYCPSIKTIQPYQSCTEHKWICDRCAKEGSRGPNRTVHTAIHLVVDPVKSLCSITRIRIARK